MIGASSPTQVDSTNMSKYTLGTTLSVDESSFYQLKFITFGEVSPAGKYIPI